MARYPKRISNPEVRSLMAEVCKLDPAYSFEFAGSGKLKLLKNGEPVTLPDNKVLTLSATPNRSRHWRQNVVGDLRMAGVWPTAIKKEAKPSRPQRPSRPVRLRVGRGKARTLALREAFAALMAIVPFHEIVELAAREGRRMDVNGMDREDVVRGRLSDLMAERVPNSATLDVFEATLVMLSPTPALVPETQEVPDMTVATGSGITCTTCGFTAKDLRGLRAHERSHMEPVKCPKCEKEVKPGGMGAHMRFCTLRITRVPVPTPPAQHRPGIRLVAGDEPYDNTPQAPGLSKPRKITRNEANAKSGEQFVISFPVEMGRALWAKGYRSVEFLATPEGIMLYPVQEQEQAAEPVLPEWLR